MQQRPAGHPQACEGKPEDVVYLTALAWLACGRLRSQGCRNFGPALA